MTLRPADEEGRDDVVAVPVEVVPGPVVPRCGPRVGMPGGYLHVAEGNPSVQHGRDVRVAEGVWTDALRDASLLAETLHDTPGHVAGHRQPGGAQQHRPRPTFGSLFTGIGGMDLGLERAGWECRWQVEINDYCRKVLARHWPAVPKFEDVRELSGDELDRVDLVVGGFPCQPVSAVGARLAQDDDRWLWPDFARILRLVRPRYAVLENVTGLFDRGICEVLGDLASLGFDAEWSVLSACSMGAPHSRERVFLVAHPPSERLEWAGFPDDPRPALLASEGRSAGVGRRWAAESKPDGVAYGTPKRVERLRGIGNAVVPDVAEWIGRRLAAHIDGRADASDQA